MAILAMTPHGQDARATANDTTNFLPVGKSEIPIMKFCAADITWTTIVLTIYLGSAI